MVSIIVGVGGLVFRLHGIGSSRIISKSNRINRMAIRKNWMEIGVRAFPKGSNPHSYGESLLISGLVIIWMLIAYRMVAVSMAIRIRVVRLIISSRGGPNAWRAFVQYTKEIGSSSVY